MKTYDTVRIEFVSFCEEDVIRTSGESGSDLPNNPLTANKQGFGDGRDFSQLK